MPSPTLTIIFGYRNREPERVDRCLASLAAQTRKDFVVLFVDYGSWPAQAAAARAVVEKYPFARYIYAETRGWVWNRSHALNIGIRLATTPYIMTSDVDILYSPDFIKTLLYNQTGRDIVHCAPRFLPPGFKEWNTIFSVCSSLDASAKAHNGVCQCVPREIAVRTQGFDEYYRMWGLEDVEFSDRMKRLGLEEKWIEEQTAIYHQWHPAGYGCNRELGWSLNWYRMLLHYEGTQSALSANDRTWGQLPCLETRCSYRFIDPDSLSLKAECVNCSYYEYDPTDVDSLAGFLRLFFALEPEQAIIVGKADVPRRSSFKSQTVSLVNCCMALIGIHLRLEFPINIMHTFLNDFIGSHRDLIGDYYIQCGARKDCTILVKKV